MCADDDADPYFSQKERDDSRQIEGGYLVITAQAAWEGGLKHEARGFLQSARSVANRIRTSATKRGLLQEIALRSRVMDRQ